MKQILTCLNRAEQLMHVVYPISKNPKVLIDAIRELHKTIPHILQTFPSLSDKHKDVLIEIRDITEKEKRACVEFSHDKKFIIANEKYDLTKITSQQVKDYIAVLKQLCQNKLN